MPWSTACSASASATVLDGPHGVATDGPWRGRTQKARHATRPLHGPPQLSAVQRRRPTRGGRGPAPRCASEHRVGVEQERPAHSCRCRASDPCRSSAATTYRPRPGCGRTPRPDERHERRASSPAARSWAVVRTPCWAARAPAAASAMAASAEDASGVANGRHRGEGRARARPATSRPPSRPVDGGRSRATPVDERPADGPTHQNLQWGTPNVRGAPPEGSGIRRESWDRG